MAAAVVLLVTLNMAGVPVVAGDSVMHYRLAEPLMLPSYANNGFMLVAKTLGETVDRKPSSNWEVNFEAPYLDLTYTLE